MELARSKKIEQYHTLIQEEVSHSLERAAFARKKNFDPLPHVEIPLAKNMAERVEGLISATSPQVANSGISIRIQELEKKFGSLDWRVALTIADEISQQKFCSFKDQLEAIEVGIRVGFAYLTMGTVSSPLEGFVGIKLRKTQDGKEYFAIQYAGPIRSAGGTAAAVSVILIDYLRKKYGFAVYDPTEQEMHRTVTELYDYHDRITNLQYKPSKDEILFLMKHLPVQIDGDPSEHIEVSNYKDLPRVETNRIRNGPCLVFGECVAQKAPKIWNQLQKWGKDFSLDQWNFLKDFVDLQKNIKSKGAKKSKTEKITENHTFIQDLVAGRPVLSYPMRNGGFRLRYGRSRISGYSAACIHPATSYILDSYIAAGTQLKVERPGKAATINFCDTIEGPIVKLKNGTVIQPSVRQAKELQKEVEEVLYLGDILFNYGDFFNRAHLLAPPGYCEEWYSHDMQAALKKNHSSKTIEEISKELLIDKTTLDLVINNPLQATLSAKDAFELSKSLSIPLHPKYTFFWTSLTLNQMIKLIKKVSGSKCIEDNNIITKVVIPFSNEIKSTLELVGIPHLLVHREFITIEKDNAQAFCFTLGIHSQHDMNNCSVILDQSLNSIEKLFLENSTEKEKILLLLKSLSSILINDKGGLFIGARMGRPEKAKMRKLKGSPHVLFPVGDEGGRLRCFQSSLEKGQIESDFSVYYCARCDSITVSGVCEGCSSQTKRKYNCKMCGLIDENVCKEHGNTSPYQRMKLPINKYFRDILEQINFKNYPDLIKGVRGTSNKEHIPEHLAKGIIRANHEIYVNKDGTTRYDMTQVPMTHFKPIEIGTPIDKLKELGYDKDCYGNDLIDETQIVEILPQDIVLPNCPQSPDEGSLIILYRIANSIDEMLTSLYKEEPFYKLDTPHDIVGHLVMALAPHTSAGIVGRIIGFTKCQGFFAHPMFHAATRRDCDGDEASILLLTDAFLNFSRKYLPSARGTTQDAPLVLSSTLIPSEVDDMAFDVDVPFSYPHSFYESCLNYTHPKDIVIEQIAARLNTEKQFEKMGFTHDTSNLNVGVLCSAYKILPSMEEKLLGQMKLATKIRAVDSSKVATLVIEKHFIRDTRGNLRKFSQQEFRCVSCNEKYRRPPLIGKCQSCNGKLLFTISEGSIIKYLEPAISLAKKFEVKPYLLQSLELTKRMVESIFGKDKEKQAGLGEWF